MSISIVTPVYNRAQLIERLYESLRRQGPLPFEWIIIDDGSVDGLDQVVERIKETATFPIKFYSKHNAGKHTAINYSLKYIDYEWVFIVDSDDVLTSDSISIVHQELPDDNDTTCKGLILLKSLCDKEEIIGEPFSTEKIYNTDLANVKGDKAIIVRKKSLIAYPFPEFENEKFVTEAIVWNRILDEGYFKAVNKTIYLVEYLAEGLSGNYHELLKKNIKGTLAFIVTNLSLKNESLSLYKQSIYHMKNCMTYANLSYIFRRVPIKRFVIFLFMMLYAKLILWRLKK